MQTYLVGGAVRDNLLGRPIKDKDWVVVGATPETLLQQGFQSVGKDFPVFLHPQTKEEYALARTERKTGAGYTGFECYFGAEVTLQEDLLRRDLTINALAQDADGNIIDPYGGQADIQNKKLRHVSDAFVEDPLRVLRVARFLARFHHLGFTVADETNQLMKTLAASGELQTLTPERVWAETEKALTEPSPWRYFEALRECNALEVVFPEVDAMFGVPQRKEHHPEVDTGVHVMMTLQAACRLLDQQDTNKESRKESRVAVLYSLLCHDLGKALTPQELLPRHHGHEDISAHLANKLSARIKTPNTAKRLALLVAKYHTHCHRALELKPATVMRTFESMDLFRRPEMLALFLLSCEADARGRTGFEDRHYPQREYLEECAKAARAVQAKALVNLGLRGEALGEELRKRRIEAIRQIKHSYVKE